jgi:hypothetical protein
MSEPEKLTYQSQMNINPALRLVAKTTQSRRPEESHQSITPCTERSKVYAAQVEKIDLLYRLIKYIKAL